MVSPIKLKYRRARAQYHLSQGKSEKDAYRLAQSEANKKFPIQDKVINNNTEDNPYYKAKQGI